MIRNKLIITALSAILISNPLFASDQTDHISITKHFDTADVAKAVSPTLHYSMKAAQLPQSYPFHYGAGGAVANTLLLLAHTPTPQPAFIDDVDVIAPKTDCNKRIAAFDVGSGSTKMKVADVDICAGRIIAVLLDDSRKVDYKEDLSNSSDSTFSATVISNGLAAIKDLKSAAAEFEPQAYKGVATSAFRDARNAQEYLDNVKKETGLMIKIISQKEEAILGFYGAVAKSDVEKKDVVVWGIGAGSMQMITLLPNSSEFAIYEGKLGSVTFKNYIIKEIQGKDASASTPNPMLGSLEPAIGYAKNAASEVPESIKQKLSGYAEVLGIGGVHYYSIKGQTGKKLYQSRDVNHALVCGAPRTDEEIGGKYASTEISNLALVSGFMDELGIKWVTTMKVNLADGLLAYQEPSKISTGAGLDLLR
ncbi:Ppx/GppA phosphatase family protein [Elusimicrobiota bacterium]